MARPLRLEFAGALYHVTARGNERRAIFFSDADRSAWLDIFGAVCDRFNWHCHVHCLMDNHYHLLVETLEGNLSKGMRQLNGVYTQYINRSRKRVGHLFQGRYKGILVEKEAYLVELTRYIVLNPVRAGMVWEVSGWPWSSYRATIGLEAIPKFLMTDWVLSRFGTERQDAVEGFVRFVQQGMSVPSPWENLCGQIYLGSERFVEEMQRKIGPVSQQLREIPIKQRRMPARPLEVYAAEYPERDFAIVAAYRSGGYSMQAIGDYFGVGRSTVSRVVKRYEEVDRKRGRG
ncbi:MAG: transposase [Sedimenticola sp.]